VGHLPRAGGDRRRRPGEIDKVAGPVGEALIMTAIGLAVAVPAVLGYNYLLGRNKTIMEQVKLFSERPRAGDRERLARRRFGCARVISAARRSRRYLAAAWRSDHGMSISTGGDPISRTKPLSAINTTPLVDVMLVLLIIFLITVPVITQSVKVDLPKAANIPTQTKPENINIAVDKDGNIYWNTAPGADPEEACSTGSRRRRAGPPAGIHVRGDKKTAYEHVGRVIVLCQRAGIQKVGFITEPPALAAEHPQEQSNDGHERIGSSGTSDDPRR
jgi:biopolymer transport protein ExbD